MAIVIIAIAIVVEVKHIVVVEH